ncbi:alpha/beta fold hydrolase [Streptomyces acidiscabies]|uniref:alpha/beta fold hydrolase n=1 Tax=Streptomyces acidiscabies TaxID=42234 RepID=UPI000952CE66|nr:alpha/beta fold hydrolase [Streptomyces acidiscabies]
MTTFAVRTRVALCSALALAALPLTASAATDALARFHEQRLDWKSCVTGPDDTTGKELEQAGAKCADVTVPLDYANPGGRTITVAISRIRGTDTAHRIGPLLLNGGGPGGSTIGDAPWIHGELKEVAGRYDVVGVDPRFVGRSTPLDCKWPTSTSIWSAPATFDAGFARNLAVMCHQNAGDVLPYATTRNTARDMDVIRAALGERKVSYLGYSYGSYLGEVYATMFPARVDRMVLDGVIDPARYSPRLLRVAEPENRAALRDWAKWTATRHATYGLGATTDAVLRTVDRIQAAATHKPLTVGPYQVDERVVPMILLTGLSQDNDQAYGQLARSVRDLTPQGNPADPSPALLETLKFILTGDESSYGSVQSAILCGDVPTERDPEAYRRDIERGRLTDPLFAPMTRNIGPCAFWPAPRETPTAVRDDFPALLVNATGDPRTTYAGAVAQRRNWPSSRLITLAGPAQHAVFGVYGNACADDGVRAYLSSGRLPAGDATCRA